MAYTQEFIDRVKALYPNSAEMHRLADEGNYFLGRWLDDSSSAGFSADEILNTPYEKLIEEAKILKEKRQLYRDFLEGRCYSTEEFRKRECPAVYLQNTNANDRYEMEKKICVGVGYVGYYPDCKKWNCKEQCWVKYDEIKGGLNG